jgi:hypothetical protein
MINIDLEKVLASGERLKANKPTESEVSKDPAAFLSTLGVDLDEETASMLRNALAPRAGGAQAARLIHIDLL